MGISSRPVTPKIIKPYTNLCTVHGVPQVVCCTMVNGLLLSVTLFKDSYLASLAVGHNTLVVTRPTFRVREGRTTQKAVQGMEL